MKKIVAAILLLFLSGSLLAQDSTAAKKVQLKIGVNYNSNLHYYGRTDSLRSSGFFPMAELWLGQNFYINAAPIFVNNKSIGTTYAGSVTTAGFLKASEKAVVHLYALKPFYKGESTLVQSALKAQAGATFSALSKVVNLTLGGDVKYSNQFDYAATASLDHLIRIQRENNIFIIDPAITVNAGTQNFLRVYREKKRGLLFPREVTVTEKSRAFNLLSCEASVPLIYVKGKVQVMATPAYVVPLNLQNGSNGTASEYGKPLFYTTLGAKYTF
jgi:hypothetical protein